MSANNKKSNTEEFITKAVTVHGNKYDYSKVDYKCSSMHITIICPTHGDFQQSPNHHLQGKGCKLCAFKQQCHTTETFILLASKVHNNKYSYDKSVYEHGESKIIITCPEHGDFLQKPRHHLHGRGCQKCANKNKGSWTKDNWAQCETSTNFTGFKLYIIECWKDGERFIKIGRTIQQICNRFAPSRIPYSWKLLKSFEGSADYIFSLEKQLLKDNKEYKYLPLLDFDGKFECFTLDVLPALVSNK